MVPCYAPWGLMQVDMHGAMTPCCFNEHNGKFGNLKDYASLQEAHNNRAFVQLRKALAKGDFKSAGCSSCKLVKVNGYGVKPDVADIEKLEAQPQLDATDANRLQNLKECVAGTTKLSSLPCHYTVTVSHKCNIDCFMCWQRDEHGNYDPAELGEEVAGRLDEIYRVAKGLHWVGGEPFALRPVHQFITNFDTALNPNLQLMATTNALLLKNKVLDKLARFKNVHLVLSIDGVSKNTYEYIRTGGSWETLQEVVPEISRVARERGWFVCMNFVVMVSNIHEIPAAVEFARKYQFLITFDPVSGDRLETENLFRYPELMGRVPNWRTHVDEGIRRAEEVTAADGTDEGAGTPPAIARFKKNVKERLEYIRTLLTASEEKARMPLPAPKRWFFPLNLILK
jgi:radical SAM protein with 4Fe4S-binding SPASM domain